VLPTNVSTPMFMNEGTFKMFRPDLENPGPDDVREVAAAFMHTLPVGWVDPLDVSNAVLFLSCDESRFVTGVSLPVDAGALLK
jgi:NAD(P)-dependent dehydrogenase (short-subunit alcohol dehydrogenase family)